MNGVVCAHVPGADEKHGDLQSTPQVLVPLSLKTGDRVSFRAITFPSRVTDKPQDDHAVTSGYEVPQLTSAWTPGEQISDNGQVRITIKFKARRPLP